MKPVASINWSQNFFWDRYYVIKLLDKTGICKSHTVVEIGPGKGIITGILAERAGRVIGVEMDSRLANTLRERLTSRQNVEIICGDFFEYQNPGEVSNPMVIGNPPFAETRRLIDKLFLDTPEFGAKTVYLVLQKEAAEKFTGIPQSTLAAVRLGIAGWGRRILEQIPRGQFKPMPKTDAAWVEFKKVRSRGPEEFEDLAAYFFINYQKGGVLINDLGKVFTKSQAEKIAADLNLTNKSIQDMNDQHWRYIYEIFDRLANTHQKELISGVMKQLKRQQEYLPKVHRTRKS